MCGSLREKRPGPGVQDAAALVRPGDRHVVQRRGYGDLVVRRNLESVLVTEHGGLHLPDRGRNAPGDRYQVGQAPATPGEGAAGLHLVTRMDLPDETGQRPGTTPGRPASSACRAGRRRRTWTRSGPACCGREGGSPRRPRLFRPPRWNFEIGQAVTVMGDGCWLDCRNGQRDETLEIPKLKVLVSIGPRNMVERPFHQVEQDRTGCIEHSKIDREQTAR